MNRLKAIGYTGDDCAKNSNVFWFNDQAEEAVNLYVSLFEDAKITNVTMLTESVAELAGKKAGDVSTIDFELNGQNFAAINGGPMYTFSEAISIAVNCKTQDEIDKLWDTLSDGGEIMSCGWLKDKYGVTWQIMPESLDAMMRDPDPEKANRVSEVMLSMEKLDIAELEKAYRGE
jgi:predicted 3-demethylubiquinone-9 3-methyltransferase (glyoxalase superfamily)